MNNFSQLEPELQQFFLRNLTFLNRKFYESQAIKMSLIVFCVYVSSREIDIDRKMEKTSIKLFVEA